MPLAEDVRIVMLFWLEAKLSELFSNVGQIVLKGALALLLL